MSILIDKETRLIIQGITGNEGLFHANRMHACGTIIMAGVTPGKGGEWILEGKVPIFDSIHTAVETTGANTSLIFVPFRFAADAICESVDSQIPLIICITEGIPVHDMMRVKSYIGDKQSRIIGPNSPGVLSPGQANVGIIPDNIVKPGSIGLVSRSGTLTYEVMAILRKNDIGVSSCVGIGGDPILGSNFVDILELFEEDPHTDQVILVGEIGGRDEEIAAEFISRNMTKPVVAYVAGITAPPGRRMGHAGAIIEGRAGSAEDKINALRNAGVRVANHPDEIPALLQKKTK